MKYFDEYRDPDLARRLATAIEQTARQIGRPVQIMEVCGGHTHAIHRHGLDQLLPDTVELVHGPGCPVCVIPMGRVDDAIAVAREPDVTLATYGDLLRVPGGRGTLLDAQAAGADIRTVYSPLDAVQIARAEPHRTVVFIALGFETTVPATAVALQQAKASDLHNFTVLSNHVTIIPAIRSILRSPDQRIDAFIGPGHVATVIGCALFSFVADEYRRPIVISGFEPTDVLDGVHRCLRQLADGHASVENQYSRIVDWDGNPRALAIINDVFELRPFFEFRGLGSLPRAGLAIRADYAAHDAEVRFELPGAVVADPKACQCGEVLKGVIRPHECKVFGTACTPETPIGTCMVSSEGACAAAYQYSRHRIELRPRRGTPTTTV